MVFPIWQYLNQPLWDKAHPITLNPGQYWQHYKVFYLTSCFENAFLERCWRVDYQEFGEDHQDFCSRTALEEDPVWLMERCWNLRWRHDRHRNVIYQQLENSNLEREFE